MAREQAHAATKISAVRRGQQGRARAAQLKADKAAAARRKAAKPSSSKAGAARRPRRSSFETDESAMASALQAAAADQEEEEEQEEQGKPTAAAAAVASLVPPSPGNLPDGGASSMAMPSKPPRYRWHLGCILRHLGCILLKIAAISLLTGGMLAEGRLDGSLQAPKPSAKPTDATEGSSFFERIEVSETLLPPSPSSSACAPGRADLPFDDHE